FFPTVSAAVVTNELRLPKSALGGRRGARNEGREQETLAIPCAAPHNNPLSPPPSRNTHPNFLRSGNHAASSPPPAPGIVFPLAAIGFAGRLDTATGSDLSVEVLPMTVVRSLVLAGAVLALLRPSFSRAEPPATKPPEEGPVSYYKDVRPIF